MSLDNLSTDNNEHKLSIMKMASPRSSIHRKTLYSWFGDYSSVHCHRRLILNYTSCSLKQWSIHMQHNQSIKHTAREIHQKEYKKDPSTHLRQMLSQHKTTCTLGISPPWMRSLTFHGSLLGSLLGSRLGSLLRSLFGSLLGSLLGSYLISFRWVGQTPTPANSIPVLDTSPLQIKTSDRHKPYLQLALGSSSQWASNRDP